MSTASILMLLAAIITLFTSGAVLARSLIVLGRMARISGFALSGLLLVIATALPEFFVGIGAGLANAPVLSLGNLIAANFLNLTIVLGVGILLAGEAVFDRSMRRSDLTAALAISVFPFVLALDRDISRLDGSMLFLACIGYFAWLLATDRETVPPSDVPLFVPGRVFRESIRFVAAAFLLIVSSAIVVTIAVNASVAFRIPIFFVGVLIAFGTTFPELVSGITAAAFRQSAFSVWNAIGGVAVNGAGILGFVAILRPIAITELAPVLFGLAATTGLLLAFGALFRHGRALDRSTGMVLVLAGLAFLIVETAFSLFR